MKTNQALNTNLANSAPDEVKISFREHYLQIIRERIPYLNPRQEEDFLRFRKMIDQILFTT